MLTAEENRTIAEIGPGKPAGEYMRRFWHPVAVSDKWDGIRTMWQSDARVKFDDEPGTATSWGDALGNFSGTPTRIRILGEDLVLFRDGAGRPGLIGWRCPHRGASFEFGRVQQDGIACCYHGWTFDVAGNCIAMPAEPPDSTFPDKVKHTAYPVQEMGGLLWAYLGPGAPPILPRFDVYAREDGVRAVENFGLWPSNYLQICENSLDQAHTGILHGGGGGERADIWGSEIPQNQWDEMPMGIRATSERPGVGNKRVSYYLMPTMNRLPQPFPGGRFRWPRFSAIWRTPVDDHHTLAFSVCFTPEVDGILPELPDGMSFDVTDALQIHRQQDLEAITSQGPIFDRTTERLAASDAGVILLRRLLMDGIRDVAEGRDPKGVLRAEDGIDPQAIIDLESIVSDDLNKMAAAE
jgi:nitrite reductase/ring-hydroxylating ferredoxin subunit